MWELIQSIINMLLLLVIKILKRTIKLFKNANSDMVDLYIFTPKIYDFMLYFWKGAAGGPQGGRRRGSGTSWQRQECGARTTSIIITPMLFHTTQKWPFTKHIVSIRSQFYCFNLKRTLFFSFVAL